MIAFARTFLALGACLLIAACDGGMAPGRSATVPAAEPGGVNGREPSATDFHNFGTR